jgi:hypothetical protein
MSILIRIDERYTMYVNRQLLGIIIAYANDNDYHYDTEKVH